MLALMANLLKENEKYTRTLRMQGVIYYAHNGAEHSLRRNWHNVRMGSQQGALRIVVREHDLLFEREHRKGSCYVLHIL